jgi:hypothetical protein
VLEEPGMSCSGRRSGDTSGAEEDTSSVVCSTGADSTAARMTEGGVESSCVVLGMEGASGKICAGLSGVGRTSAPARSIHGAECTSGAVE